MCPAFWVEMEVGARLQRLMPATSQIPPRNEATPALAAGFYFFSTASSSHSKSTDGAGIPIVVIHLTQHTAVPETNTDGGDSLLIFPPLFPAAAGLPAGAS